MPRSRRSIVSKAAATSLVLLASSAQLTFAQTTGGIDPVAYSFYQECADCSSGLLSYNALKLGDNECVDDLTGAYSVRILCSAAVSLGYTANFYGSGGCAGGNFITAITGYGSGCVSSFDQKYSTMVNCQYPAIQAPETAANQLAALPTDVVNLLPYLNASPLQTGGQASFVNSGKVGGSGAPAGFGGDSATGGFGGIGNGFGTGSLIGGSGASFAQQLAAGGIATGSTGPSGTTPDGSIISPSFNPQQAAAEQVALGLPAGNIVAGQSTSNAQRDQTSGATTSSISMFAAAAAVLPIVWLTW